MSPESVKSLFLQALDVEKERRGAFLDEQCTGDAELRAAVAELLEFDTKAENSPTFLDSPVAGMRRPLLAPEFIGRYRLVRLLGEGGMGTVYEAEQDQPRRTVALKVIRPGFASPRHREAVQPRGPDPGPAASPGHCPGLRGRRGRRRPAVISRWSSSTDCRWTSTPAAEASTSLPAWVSWRGCATRCSTPHDQGVIHRDLKPANILVEETGQPKVLDFGVARATGADLLTTAGLTQDGQLIGTPELHEPRAGGGRPRRHRPPDRRVRAGGDPLRAWRLTACRTNWRTGRWPRPPG